VAEPDDNDLVLRVTAGDQAAFRTIVERHQERIFYLGLQFLHSMEDAQDYAQEVFLRAYRKIDSFRGEVPFAAWLYRLAFNLAVNGYHVSRRKLVEASSEGLAIPAREPTPEMQLVETETVDEVRRVLARLPEAYNIVIRMHFFDGMSYPEISTATGLPVNTIKSHVFRAKRILRKHLSDYGRQEPEEVSV
jgi:RNA polymerase sigma-70 factor (ECF subfamily)